MPKRTCSIAGCESGHYAKGWCRTHWRRWKAHGDPLYRAPTLTERFWAKVDKDGPVPSHAPTLGPCWLWTASLDRHGYGEFQWDGTQRAHRVAYALLNSVPLSEVPPELDHLCRVRNCVLHTEPVTRRENSLRGAAPAIALHLAGKCKQGHDASESVRRRGNGEVVYCKACRRERRAAS